MNWFKPKYTECQKCGLLYRTPPEDALFGHLCKTCRQPLLDEYRRKEVVMKWCANNWKKLEEQVKEDNKRTEEEYNNAMRIRHGYMMPIKEEGHKFT